MANDENEFPRRQLFTLATMGIGGALMANKLDAQSAPSFLADITRGELSLPPIPLDQTKLPAPPSLEELRATESSEHFSRNPDEEALWAKLRLLLENDSSITSGQTTSGDLGLSFLPLHAGFRFAAEPEDDDFSPFQVETLLDQAADLLDRAIRERAAWDDMLARHVDLILELQEFRDLDEIHQEEERAGIYDVDYKESLSLRNAESANTNLQLLQEREARSILANRLSGLEFSDVYNAFRAQAFTNGLLAFSFQGQNFGGYVQHNVFGKSMDVSHISIMAAEFIARHDLLLTRDLNALALWAFVASRTLSEQRLPGVSARRDWERENADFKRRRTAVARRYEDIKARLAVDPEGPLNYAKRLVSMRERYQQDFRNALARMLVAQKGLSLIYGHNVPLPPDSGSKYFDDCLLWTRSAIHFLIRFAHREQNLVLPISLADLLGSSNWRKGLKRGVWQFSFPESLVRDLRHVRLRGLSAFAVGHCIDNKLWTIQLACPEQARVTHLSGSSVTIDQTELPPVLLARVAGRNHEREPDIGGITALHNASPIGTWKVDVVGTTLDRARTQLRDLVVEFHLAYRVSRHN